MRISRKEIFGPVVAVIPFDDVDDAAAPLLGDTELRAARQLSYRCVGMCGNVPPQPVRRTGGPVGKGAMAVMGRPRGFDVEEALDVALLVFWRQGYEGTNLSDLSSAMGINRPALYAAFKSKKDLFFRALERYYAVDAARTFAVLDELTARLVTEQYLFRSVEQLTNPDRPLGCFVLQSALVCSEKNTDIAARMADQRRHHAELLGERYARAQRDGDLAETEDPAALARFVTAFRHGLAVMACGGTPRDELLDSARRMIVGLYGDLPISR